MPRPQKIPDQQLERIHRLESRLDNAILLADLKRGKIILNDIRGILERFDHHARLNENYLRFYETALELGEVDLARGGFEFILRRVSSSTRMYLEAKTLLAICFLRKRDILSAEPHIIDVLKNDKVIKSEESRRKFREETIQRLDEEGALSALANLYPETLDEGNIQSEAIKILKDGGYEDELLEGLGSTIPDSVKDFILKIDELSKNQLPSHERLMLPGPKQVLNNKVAGGIFIKAIGRKLYPHLCDKDSKVHKAWIEGGVDAILGSNFLVSAVVAALADFRILAPAIAARTTAYLLKRGITNICENNKPRSIMSLRRKGRRQ